MDRRTGSLHRPRWPERVLTFGSLRQATREPILDALHAREWDLVVVDLSGGTEGDVASLQELLAGLAVRRMLLLDDAPSDGRLWSWIHAEPLPYDVPDVANATQPPLNFSVVEYGRSATEIDLAHRAQELMMEIRNLRLPVKARLTAAVMSSPVAAQSQAWAAADSLRQLRNRVAHGLPAIPDEEPGEAFEPKALPRLERLRDGLMRFGEDVELMETDSKWDAFLAAMSSRVPSPSVVFCDFAETVVYVADRLQAAGIHAMTLDDLSAVASLRDEPNAVLVSRDDQLLGVEIRGVRLAYNYDLPASQRRAHIRWSRLDLTHGDPPSEMVTLLDRRGASPTERMAFAQLRYMVGSE